MNLIKNLLLIAFLSIFGLTAVDAQRPFITIWNTAEKGVTANNQIEFPGLGDYVYTYEDLLRPSVKGTGRGEGTEIITFPEESLYKISVLPLGDIGFYGMNCAESEDAAKLVQIVQWGEIEWKQFKGAFQGAKWMKVSASDIPDLSRVDDMSYAFKSTLFLDTISNMNKWDVSNVLNMSHMFAYSSNFNEDIGNWDVSSVTNMEEMFSGADGFNQDISNWDVSSVTNMKKMFSIALSFNQPIGKWDVSNVVDMDFMFYTASRFNQNLNSWDVRNVKYMKGIFLFADAFDFDNLRNWKFHPHVDQLDLK